MKKFDLVQGKKTDIVIIKKEMKKIVFVFCLVLVFVGCHNRENIVDKQELLARDFRLFQHTPAWELAKAVQDEEVDAIEEEVTKQAVDPNFREPKYGGTLLMLAIYNAKYRSTKTLLALGADPNLGDTYKGESAMIDAAENKDIRYLRLLLAYKGNPNAVENAYSTGKNSVRSTPLNAAISSLSCDGLEKVRLLVEAGANVNYARDDDEGFTRLPLAEALLLKRMEIVLYLLENGADYTSVLYTTVNNKKVYILEDLRKCRFELDSKEHTTKKKIILFLKTRKLSYENEPIPDYILKEIQREYPLDWKDYIKKY